MYVHIYSLIPFISTFFPDFLRCPDRGGEGGLLRLRDPLRLGLGGEVRVDVERVAAHCVQPERALVEGGRAQQGGRGQHGGRGDH